MVKIAFYEVRSSEKRYFKRKLKGNTLVFFDKKLDKQNLVVDADIISVSIYSEIDLSLLKKAKRLKLITTRSTGYDHISLQDAKKKKVTVCNVPSYGENTVAEHAFALMLTLSRNVHKSYLRTLQDDYSIEGLTGFDLKDKTIGIIGGGRIGLHVARMAKAFGMHVFVYDLRRDTFLEEIIGFRYVDFDDLLKVSDIVSLHLPHNKHTHQLINKNTIAKMKKGAILINTARGGIVDTDALYLALKNKHIGGAGLDTIEGEELIKEDSQLYAASGNSQKIRQLVRDHKIFNMDNVIFTPHNAFNSKEALVRILDETILNIRSYLKGNPRNELR